LIEFEKPDVNSVDEATPEDFDCSQGGSAHRGVFGPFGLLVHTDDALTEQTAVFFYISHVEGGQWAPKVCSDQSRCVHEPTTIYLLFDGQAAEEKLCTSAGRHEL
jgi:hypothetical protein